MFKPKYELNAEGKPILTEKHYTVDPDTGCWFFKGYIANNGYGSVAVRRGAAKLSHFLPHRLMFQQFKGKIPHGLELDHLCRQRACINPAHLEAVTSRVNTLRGEGPTAQNARRTHCRNGHEFSMMNTYHFRRPDDRTYRACRECGRIKNRRARLKAKQATSLKPAA